MLTLKDGISIKTRLKAWLRGQRWTLHRAEWLAIEQLCVANIIRCDSLCKQEESLAELLTCLWVLYGSREYFSNRIGPAQTFSKDLLLFPNTISGL